MIKIRKSLAEEKERQRNSNFNFIIGLMAFAIILYTVVVICAVSTRFLLTVLVDGSSMNPTLKDGQVIVVNQTIEPKRGDIVIIDMGDRLLVKRVIGMGGDTIEIKDGKVYRNSVELKENYVKKQGVTGPEISAFVVPDGEIYFLGDNRENSNDSRAIGTVKESKIIGVMVNQDSFLVKLKLFLNGT